MGIETLQDSRQRSEMEGSHTAQNLRTGFVAIVVAEVHLKHPAIESIGDECFGREPRTPDVTQRLHAMVEQNGEVGKRSLSCRRVEDERGTILAKPRLATR
jgi:hypothetical protein